MSLGTVAKTNQSVRVMIVDDSALMRKLLTQMLTRGTGIDVIDTAMDGQFALDHLRRIKPDVILMDIDMPRLDGLSALDRIVTDYALPVVMCSTRTVEGSQATLDALARGAVDFIEKPSLAALTSGEAAADIIARVRGAAGAQVAAHRRRRSYTTAPLNADAPAAPQVNVPLPVSAVEAAVYDTPKLLEQIRQMAKRTAPEIVAIGTSTGGPPALEQVLAPLPKNFPLGIVIVQHMPAGFTSLLATHLNRVAQLEVREAEDGELIRPGVALIAPGGTHLRVVRNQGHYVAALDREGALVSGHRPSVDVLFDSVLTASQGHAAAVLMTGMGSDGANALGRLANAGGLTIVQAPETCVVAGMPKSAIERGYARAILPLEDLAAAINACSGVSQQRHS